MQLRFQREVERPRASSPTADLIVAADGINCRIRETLRASISSPSVDLRPNKFAWLGSTQPLDAFKLLLPRDARTASSRALPTSTSPTAPPGSSRPTPETLAQTSGFDELDEADDAAGCSSSVFADELDGHRLITNRSLWRNFPTISNRRWVTDNVVLMGDAKATAHFSIGSGTKLAMEDAIALLEALRARTATSRRRSRSTTRARREEVEKTQHAANVSLAWFEHMRALLGHGRRCSSPSA